MSHLRQFSPTFRVHLPDLDIRSRRPLRMLPAIYVWPTHVETRPPKLPKGVRVGYPMARLSCLLPPRLSNQQAPMRWLESQGPASSDLSDVSVLDTGVPSLEPSS